MISRSKGQQPLSQRQSGSSPLKQLNYLGQKENFLLNNNVRQNKPLISPKHQNSQMLTFDRAPKQKTNFLKPIRSPRSLITTQRSNNMIACSNHQTKKAQFRIFTQEGEQYFCGRCAAQLVTQGCQVQQLQSSCDKGMRTSKKNSLPHIPQFQNEPIYHQIIDILKLCNSVVNQHTSNIQKFTNLQEQYNQQVQLTSAFYDRLIQIIEEMKSDHLSDLLQEKDKYTQIADIENDNSRENIIQINNIKSDIQSNMQEVLQGIQNTGDSSQCTESLQHYRHKLTLYRHQTEEQLDSISQVTRYSQRQINSMIQNFQNFLRGMWQQAQSPQNHEVFPKKEKQKQMNSALTVKNIHQILPRGVTSNDKSTKSAFRNLQVDEEEEITQEAKSPNFKKI